jgi:hypothetical protein
MLDISTHTDASDRKAVKGEFLTIAGERYYAIRNVDEMAPFFISIISNTDHWLFVSSSGGLTAGRVSPDTALFPYITVDRIHESASHTGGKTLLRVGLNGQHHKWEPFEGEHSDRYMLTRNIYKNTLGNKLCLEEINHDLQVAFRCTWQSSEPYGFVRECELENLSAEPVKIEVLDGLQNVLPAGTPRVAQTNTSNLVDAYKWTELDPDTGLAMFTLFSAVTDRAEPCESLRANTVFCLGLNGHKTLISSEQVNDFRGGKELHQEVFKRGMRGAYLVNATLDLSPGQSQQWQIVSDVEKTQGQVILLRNELADPAKVAKAVAESVASGSDELARIMAAADGFQAVEEEDVALHHYANVLFNVLRGGIFDDQYNVSSWDFTCTLGTFNRAVYERHREMLGELPDTVTFSELLAAVKKQGDPQLERLCHEYLPIRFGRRHGDPSRPWNLFAIKLRDDAGNRMLSYEGNWRDIFQNWEALAFSYPDFIENIISKFVNASTVDGYNPYRITKEGIDWEVEDADDPWSYIGYWGDHQIIYLQKLLELSRQFHPTRLGDLLHEPIFCYANVPYRIKPFSALLEDPKATVQYDDHLAEQIERRVSEMGADGKLVLDSDGDVYQVNLLEKLLVPLLAKLGNLVIDGGIWLNTQRPEWNDANNALVGQGLSIVTLCYMRRYVKFLQQTLADENGSVELSGEIAKWLTETGNALREAKPLLGGDPISSEQRFDILKNLSEAADRYRTVVYKQGGFSGKTAQAFESIMAMLDDALVAIDHSIANNRREEDGLYHAYNLLNLKGDRIEVDHLYKMLEGQVAALSSGAVDPKEAIDVLDALFASDVYRHDQKSFMLYPDRDLPTFLEKNRIPSEAIESIPLLKKMVQQGDERIVVKDIEGNCRFNAEFVNVGLLNAKLDALGNELGDEVEASRQALQALYEAVFDHKSFTGRSGGMFGFEGLGCIYWHMVSKLLLAVQENFFRALAEGADKTDCERLGHLYYRVREGIGFNKTPEEYGAFPTDPYSHTPKHAGAQQPGMTGQVKEEVLSRFGELGVRISNGTVRFEPDLLRHREFVSEPRHFRFLDVNGSWQDLKVPAKAVAFTWCQVPVVYQLVDEDGTGVTLTSKSGDQKSFGSLALPTEESSELFLRSGRIRQITVNINKDALFTD